ncbi:hypothetical protein [Microbacterium sp. Clip185]|uniref:hypothetical protein n=1 Tax=Microbacterium sp. Clip185 TaxID=3025663 RepID=UPI0023660ADE|nr:hypothetical protein [Microbacterium sp. Clip185]WDG18180.1 hypothetical protein PQV94_00235 [Microbacterium sp. Clip185]
MELFDELVLSVRRGQPQRESLGDEVSAITEMIRPFHFERFADAWSHPKRASERGRFTGESTFSRAGNESTPSVPWMKVDEGHVAARLDQKRSRRSVLPKVQILAVATTFNDYWLGEGLSGLRETAQLLESRRSYLALHALHLDEGAGYSRRTGDPFKAYRAAAFAGARVKFPASS